MISAAFLLLPALAAATPLNPAYTPLGRRDGAPPADQITIVSSTYSGNGCPQGSVSTSLSLDKTVITFGFDSFQTYIGPTAAQADKTKNCQLHLGLQYPGGFQYAVTDAVYHGYARLDAGVTGNFLSTYYFSQDASKTTTTKSSISGAAWVKGDVYTKEDQVETTATIWSPCGDTGILNVNNRIALTSTVTSATGELSNDDATVSFTHQAHVSWRPCTPGGSTGGGVFAPGPGTVVVSRDGAPAAGTTITGGGSSTGPTSAQPSDVWTVGPGSTTITHG